MKKILIAHNNKIIVENIIRIAKKQKNIKSIEITSNGLETQKRIIEFVPDIVFLKCDFVDKKCKDILSKVSQKLNDNMPTFNLIYEKDFSKDELLQIIKISNCNINSLIYEYEDLKKRVEGIFKDYNNFKI